MVNITIICNFASLIIKKRIMRTEIHGKSRSKVSFIDDMRAKVELENGESTWVARRRVKNVKNALMKGGGHEH